MLLPINVPLMEENPSCRFTNVIETKNLADLSSKYLVEKFVLISTDKAVNPVALWVQANELQKSMYNH